MSNIRFMMSFVTVWCLIDITNAAQTKKCSEGKYLHQDDDTSFCIECPHGTFMPWKNHTANRCFDCSKVEDPNVEILIRPCHIFHDADVQCVDGFYRRLARNPLEKPTCLKCRPACPDYHPHPVHSCQNFSDLGCCIGENYDYYIGEGGVRMCRERPWMCRRGQYLDDWLYECRPCPENTFMPEDYHSHTKCWNCQYLSDADLPLHAVITQPCTSTQSPRYGCKERFYVNHGLGYRGDDIGCSPCQTCDEGKYVGRQCDMYHDTVCCDKPNMTVVDGPKGAQCVEKIDCKDGTYNPPACDKTCSQHCRVSETSDVSPCDNNNGTCLFGCLNGYTGDMCETVQRKSGNQENVNDGIGEEGYTIAPWIIIVLVVLVVISCVMYNKYCPGFGPKWWQGLVGHIFRQPKGAAAEETELGQPLSAVAEETELGQQMTLRAAAEETELDQPLRKVYRISWPKIFPTEETEQGQALMEAGNTFTQPEESDAEDAEKRRHLVADQWRNDIKSDKDQYQIDADTPGTELRQRRGKPAKSQKAKMGHLHHVIIWCKTNPGHRNFTSTKTFNRNHLPFRYRDKLIVNYVKATSALTCRLSVSRISGGKSETWLDSDTPVQFSAHNKWNSARTGTGWVSNVIMLTGDKRKCECEECRQPGTHTPKKMWGEVYISTAFEVVHDDEEAWHTKYQFFDDSNASDLNEVPTLTGLKVVESDSSRNVCMLKYVTHEVKLLDKFYKMYRCWEKLQNKVYRKFVSDKCPGVGNGTKLPHDLCIIVSHPHGYSKEVTVGEWTHRHVVDKDDGTENIKYVYNTPTCLGSEGAPVITLVNNRWPLMLPVHSKCLGDNNSSGVGREKILML